MHESKDEDEIELLELLNVFWRWKWLILVLFFFCIGIAIFVNSFVPKLWKVDAIIQPSKFLVQTEQGNFDEVLIAPPSQIVAQINQEAYTSVIAAELNLNIREIPKIKAENLTDTSLVIFSMRTRDTIKAKAILQSLFRHLKENLDKKVEIEMKEIESRINLQEIEKMSIKKEIGVLKNKFNIVQQRKKELEKSVEEVTKRIKKIESEQELSLKQQDWNESKSLGMLLYSNEIQQSIQFLDTLNEFLNMKRIEGEDIRIEIENQEKRIKQIENIIDNLNERKGRIDYTQLIKEPTSSIRPVFPRKMLNIVIGGVLGLFFPAFISLFIEYFRRYKSDHLTET